MAPDTIERSPIALKDPSLLRQQCYVDGQWIDADDGGSMPVVDPATGMPVGTAPVMHAAETRARDRRGEPRTGPRGAARPRRSDPRSCANGRT